MPTWHQPFGTNCHINITGRKHAFVIVTKSNLFSFSFFASHCPPQCIGCVIPSEDFASITSWFLFNHSMFVHSVSNVECQASFTWPCRRLNWPSQIIINGGEFFFRVGMLRCCKHFPNVIQAACARSCFEPYDTEALVEAYSGQAKLPEIRSIKEKEKRSQH